MKKKRVRNGYLFLAGVLCLWISHKQVVLQTKSQIYTTIEAVPFRPYGLVLGASKDGKNGLNPYFKNRMDATLLLYEAQKIDTIIVSGENSSNTYNETQDMTDYLVEHGVPRSKIIRDFAGFRTLDSVVRSKKVFGCDSLIIISQEFHNQRALYIANYYGIQAIAYNAKDASSSFNLTHIREYFAKFLVLIDLHILKTKPIFL